MNSPVYLKGTVPSTFVRRYLRIYFPTLASRKLVLEYLFHIVDDRTICSVVTLRFKKPTRASRQINRVARVSPSWRPVRRRARLTTGKHAVRRQRWRTPSSGARIGVDEFASSDTTSRLSYDNIMVSRVNRLSTSRLWNRSSGATSGKKKCHASNVVIHAMILTSRYVICWR